MKMRRNYVGDGIFVLVVDDRDDAGATRLDELNIGRRDIGGLVQFPACTVGGVS